MEFITDELESITEYDFDDVSQYAVSSVANQILINALG